MSIDSRKLVRKLDSMSGIDLRRGVERAMKTVQADAKIFCPGNTGELQQSIMTTVEGTSDYVIGKCYTDKRYAPYVEFGTGPVGEANHQGISPTIEPSYVQHGWGIPAYAIDRNDAVEKYHFKEGVYEDSNGFQYLYYYTNGQPAHPFMYPALKDNEEKVTDQIAEACRKDME